MEDKINVGNWIKTCTPDMEIMIPHLESQVQGITIFGELEFDHSFHQNGFRMPPKHTVGIPITDEWMRKFGFIKNKYWLSSDTIYWELPGKLGLFYICQIKNAVGVNKFSLCYPTRNGTYSPDIHGFYYVHNLQNLINCLTDLKL